MREFFVIIALGIGLVAASFFLFDIGPTCEIDGTTVICTE